MISYSTRIIFMGTPEFAVATLKALNASGVEIAAVVTAPDKPAGRGKKLKCSAVKEFALSNLTCPIFQPENLKDEDFISRVRKLNAHIFIVVAFRMLPEIVWRIPRYGTINLHASLLPHYRGAAPINWALINGESKTGVTTFLIDKEIDTGRILLQSSVNISTKDNAETLHNKLMTSGSELIVKTVAHVMSGDIDPVDQSKFNIQESNLKKAPKIFKEDCRIQWNANAGNIYNFVRGLSPFPGAHALFSFEDREALQFKIFHTLAQTIKHSNKTGTILSDNKSYIHVAVNDGFIEILDLQSPGKKRMAVADFLRGFNEDLNTAKAL